MKYAVKVIANATQDNVNFPGQTRVSYYGKQEKTLNIRGTEVLDSYLVSNYGYSRKCDAVRTKNFLEKVFRDCENLGVKWNHELFVVAV